MKLGHIAPINFNIPNGRGGPERVFYDLNESIVKVDPSVYLNSYAAGNSKVSGHLKYIYPTELNSYKPFNDSDRFERCKYSLNHCAFAFKDFNEIDIFQAHSVDFALPMSSSIHKKTVITLHNPVREGLKFLIQKFNHPNVHFVVLSQTQAKVLETFTTNFSIIHNGIDVENIDYSEQKQDYYLFIGRLEENKGADIAIRACIQANKKLVLIGKPRDTSEISMGYFNNKIKPFLDHELITYLPVIDHQEIFKYYAKAQALLFPLQNPLMETFGLVTVEALASGTPVVAQKNSLMEELIKNNYSGYLYEKEDELVHILQNNLITNLNFKDCRAEAEARFSRDIMAKKYLELYANLLA